MIDGLATRVVLAARPKGKPIDTDFRIVLEGRNFGKLIIKVSQ